MTSHSSVFDVTMRELMSKTITLREFFDGGGRDYLQFVQQLSPPPLRDDVFDTALPASDIQCEGCAPQSRDKHSPVHSSSTKISRRRLVTF